MNDRIVAVAGALLGMAGSAGAMQGNAPTLPVNVDANQAVNACVSADERQRPLTEISVARRRAIVACVFQATARQINPQLPVQVDNVTRLDRITVSGATLTYHYTVARRLADLPANARQIMEGTTRNNACAQANMRQTLQMGGSYGYRWVDSAGRQIHRMTISAC